MNRKTNKIYRLKIITKLLLISIITFSLHSNIYAQDQIVSLPNGKKVVLYSDKTWDYYEGLSYDYDFSKLRDNQIPDFLRQGIKVNRQTLVVAVEMNLQGWRYFMPRPKSSQASWGNYDGRTTWWKGYWYNNKTNKYSRGTPKKQSNGNYYGDGQNDKGYWRNGGSPSYPSKIDWLLSSYGGVKPY
jgi:hypothetical protein